MLGGERNRGLCRGGSGNLIDVAAHGLMELLVAKFGHAVGLAVQGKGSRFLPSEGMERALRGPWVLGLATGPAPYLALWVPLVDLIRVREHDEKSALRTMSHTISENHGHVR